MANDVIAAVATPPGRGGIGSSGFRAPTCARCCAGWSMSRRCATARDAGKFSRCECRHHRSRSGACIFPRLHSYTGEDVIELHGHGGPVVASLLLARCLELGARIAEPGEFTKRAFLNGKLDLAQAEGVADLIDATTGEAARCALRSLAGRVLRADRSTGRSR